MTSIAAPQQFRTLFLSDLHLGTRGCQVRPLLNFLRHHEAETIYLVGDIIDGWRLQSRWYWPDAHNDVLRCLMNKARRGTRLVYLPGNHDEFARSYNGTESSSLEFTDNAIHEAADGKRYLVVHGDCFDPVQTKAPWLAYLGDHAYAFVLVVNTGLNRVGRRLGLPYWSLSNWLKMRVKSAVNFIGHYEETVVAAAREHKVDGVICGHIHRAAVHDGFGLKYVNCGDWVESCTAVVEHFDGRMEVIRSVDLSEPAAIDEGFEGEFDGMPEAESEGERAVA
ncbi:UDP-2,3-diacylglucosamine diphosphatase [soil metagenome]